jgi:hypothetical protein
MLDQNSINEWSEVLMRDLRLDILLAMAAGFSFVAASTLALYVHVLRRET